MANPDAELVERIRNRDETALEDVKRRYSAYCLSIANGILQNHQDAEECLSDALFALWKSIPPHDPADLKTFLGKLTRNAAVSRLRKTQAQRRVPTSAVFSLEELESLVGSDSVEEALSEKELSECISGFLRALPKMQRLFFVRRYWYCDAVKDIAERFGCSEGKVAMSLKRTRDELAETLKNRGYHL